MLDKAKGASRGVLAGISNGRAAIRLSSMSAVSVAARGAPRWWMFGG